MPFALVAIGLLCVMVALRGTYKQAGSLLLNDLTGENNFIIWSIAIMGVGLVGYYGPFQKFSRACLCLVLLSVILSHHGFFEQLFAALKAGPVAPQGSVSLSAQTQGVSTTGAVTPSQTDYSSQNPATGGSIGSMLQGFIPTPSNVLKDFHNIFGG